MGEYAMYQGQQVKIGTCESMYYLRADQAHKVRSLGGNVDPVRDRDGIRFRFPFPAEDGTAPGEFNYPLPKLTVNYPAELPASHGTITVDNGKQQPARISAALPCPMVAPEIWHQYVRSNPPRVNIAYQGHRNGHLAVIVECAYCETMWNLSETADAELLVTSIRSQADAMHRSAEMSIRRTHEYHGPDCGDPAAERDIHEADELHTVADRIMAGYVATAAAKEGVTQ